MIATHCQLQWRVVEIPSRLELLFICCSVSHPLLWELATVLLTLMCRLLMNSTKQFAYLLKDTAMHN